MTNNDHPFPFHQPDPAQTAEVLEAFARDSARQREAEEGRATDVVFVHRELDDAASDAVRSVLAGEPFEQYALRYLLVRLHEALHSWEPIHRDAVAEALAETIRQVDEPIWRAAWRAVAGRATGAVSDERP